MKTNKFLLLSFALLTLLFTGCTKNDETSVTEDTPFTFGESVQKAFIGKIVDTHKNPIANVSVSINGLTVVTNADGEFSFNNVTVKERFAYFTAEKSGFIKGSRVVYPNEGLTSVYIMMMTENVTATINSGQTAVVSLENQTKVKFDGAFMTEAGVAYNGAVKVIMNHLDPADPNVFYKMPGNLIAINKNGEIKGLQTYGMLDVVLKGNNNQRLQIATGHTAEIIMPIASTQTTTAPATMALWHFNEDNGLWEEDGFSTRVGNNYVGTVSHFSCWNNDYAYEASVLTVIATNFDGTPVKGVRITLTRMSGSTGDVLIDLGTTNTNGRLSANTPKNEQLTFKAYTPDGTLITSQTLPATTANARTIYVSIPAPNKN